MMTVMNNFVGDGNGYVGNIDLKPEKAYTPRPHRGAGDHAGARAGGGCAGSITLGLAAQRLDQRGQKFAEGQHHQHEAGVELAQGVIAAVLLGLLLQQILEAHFPESIQEEIADEMGFDIHQSRKVRDPLFRQQVLLANILR
jgi:hypothetical protein